LVDLLPFGRYERKQIQHECEFPVIIGNREYSDPGLAQLAAPSKHREDFASVLKDPEFRAFYAPVGPATVQPVQTERLGA
jgi:hypothetical protein